MTKLRIESDSLGSLNIPKDALYGIHSLRASQNFPDRTPFNKTWYQSVGLVKHACYLTYKKFKAEALKSIPLADLKTEFFDEKVIDALITSSLEVSEGNYFEAFIVPAIQGGAGTSINMNVNEIIANVALKKLNLQTGDYQTIDPIEQANVFQSTNDVIPTALHVAAMQLLKQLETSINELRFGVEKIESAHRNHLRQAYTQMQEAVPSSYDKLFSTYSNALSRDWWRVSKCLERIKEVNLGGGAIGTGLSVPRFFIMHATTELQKLTGLPLARAENMCDATANTDVWVEVHATLKAHAVNLEKMVSDLRLLGSDLFRHPEVKLPQKQVGSSIMPGKINPVIAEYVISTAHKVYANDLLISNLCGQGCLELNAYLPTIGYALLETLQLLINANQSALNHLIDGLVIHSSLNYDSPIFMNPSITTALSPYIGYHHAAQLAKEMKEKQVSVVVANGNLKLIDPDSLTQLLQPSNLLKMGYSLKES